LMTVSSENWIDKFMNLQALLVYHMQMDFILHLCIMICYSTHLTCCWVYLQELVRTKAMICRHWRSIATGRYYLTASTTTSRIIERGIKKN
jgi:hypothetical protein